MPKVLIISVGGSPEPVIHSINDHQPDYVIYFVSAESRLIVRGMIEPALQQPLKDHDLLVTSDKEDLVASVDVLQKGIPPLLQQWDVEMTEVIGDFTGGTKTMSAALVLMLARLGVRFSYIGGQSRSKDGLGVVTSGEVTRQLKNPWDALALGSLKEIELLFNRCRFRAVRDLAEQTAARTERHGEFFRAMRNLAEGFYYWDSFLYAQALSHLGQGLKVLRPYAEASSNPGLREFCRQTGECLQTLEAILRDTVIFKSNPSRRDKAGDADGTALTIDLVANAVRRADIEFKYEDAVARLYSAIEKLAKARLKATFSIDNSNVDLAVITDTSLHQELAGLRSEEDGRIQLPLHRSYLLLAALGDPLGKQYLTREDELRKVLNVRNDSLLAHGFVPVTAETFAKLLAIALDFIDRERGSIPAFPLVSFGQSGL